MSNVSIKEFIERVSANDQEFISDNGCYHFYDWFCKPTSLENKFKGLFGKVKKISKSPKIDTEKMYVFFKNNCPMNGPLYDDLRICDIEKGEVVFTVTPKSGHTGLAEVWGRENDFSGPIVEGSWKDVLDFFGVK